MCLQWFHPRVGKTWRTHSSILASKIPWTEELGGLQTMGLQRIGHDLASNTYFKRLFYIFKYKNI